MADHARPLLEELDEAQCVRLISPGGIGRIAYLGRYDLTVLPVNYRWVDGTVMFRTARDSITGEDLRTGIANADFKVAFEIDRMDERAREGWSVLIQGPAHHIDSESDQAAAMKAGVHSWAGEDKDHFIRVTPTRITGRRVRQPA
jgi:nitroimidazol reductase NimA-like FMN-containing flavoprotein (pyridoxamine 5'-phosphate oxidase superfamily)